VKGILSLPSPEWWLICLLVAGITFIAAFMQPFFFTYIRSRKEGVPVWGNSARRLMFNTAIPLAAGAFVVYRMLEWANMFNSTFLFDFFMGLHW